MKKECTFGDHTLYNYMNEHYKELTGTNIDKARSECMLLYDLKRWGFKHKDNSKRSYFEGHERADVLPERNKFVDYFLSRIDNYYTVNELDNSWVMPIEKMCILIFHDESTFRSAEQDAKRWFKEGFEPFLSKGRSLKLYFILFQVKLIRFFTKGRGKSWMVSDFLVAHPSSPFFSLNEDEWTKATSKYPSLLVDHGVHYCKVEKTRKYKALCRIIYLALSKRPSKEMNK